MCSKPVRHTVVIIIMNEPARLEQIICTGPSLDFAILSHISLFLDAQDYLFYKTLPSYFMDICSKMYYYGIMVLLIKLLVNTKLWIFTRISPLFSLVGSVSSLIAR